MAFVDLPDWNMPIYITGITIASIPINIVAQTLGVVRIDIFAQSLGVVNVNIAASAVIFNVNISSITGGVVFNVNITGSVAINVNVTGSVELNIKTTGGANIIIDVLTVAAYLERRSTLSNSGVGIDYMNPTGANREGKFFPRGCRGFIKTIDVYCKDNAAAGGTITVYITPYIGAGYVYTRNIAVPPGNPDAWLSATFNVMWNYDSLFISVVGSVAAMYIAYDAGTPVDHYRSTDSGATWTFLNYRLHARAIMGGETCGDVPVSGTINNIEIPSSSSLRLSGDIIVFTPTETDMILVNGAGTCDYILTVVYSSADTEKTVYRVYCDGVLAMLYSFDGLSLDGITASTPKISLTAYAVDGHMCAVISKIFAFKRELKVTAQNLLANVTCRCDASPNLIT